MRKPKLLLGLVVTGLVAGGYGGYRVSGDFDGISSLAGLAIGFGVILWLIFAYLDD